MIKMPGLQERSPAFQTSVDILPQIHSKIKIPASRVNAATGDSLRYIVPVRPYFIILDSAALQAHPHPRS